MHSLDRYRGPGALSAGCLFAILASPAAEAGSANFATTNIQYLHGTRYADFDPSGGFSEDDESS
ncbi:MAG: hypothetical protein WBN85_09545, partial [Candidatus Macondimonas sp.]